MQATRNGFFVDGAQRISPAFFSALATNCRKSEKNCRVLRLGSFRHFYLTSIAVSVFYFIFLFLFLFSELSFTHYGDVERSKTPRMHSLLR